MAPAAGRSLLLRCKAAWFAVLCSSGVYEGQKIDTDMQIQ